MVKFLSFRFSNFNEFDINFFVKLKNFSIYLQKSLQSFLNPKKIYCENPHPLHFQLQNTFSVIFNSFIDEALIFKFLQEK